MSVHKVTADLTVHTYRVSSDGCKWQDGRRIRNVNGNIVSELRPALTYEHGQYLSVGTAAS